ncbi:MAG: aminoglycoside phosphotransferase family protein [Chloroflexota bacterium]
MAKVPKLPIDPTFPQLTSVADMGYMLPLFQEMLNAKIAKVRIDRFQYVPFKSCTINYELDMYSNGSEQTERKLMYGLLRNREAVPARPAPPTYKLSQLDMELWAFPDDPKLPHLANFLDADFLLALVNEPQSLFELTQKDSLVQNGRFQTVKTKVIKYVPEGRCVLQHSLWQGDVTMPPLILYSKTFLRADGERNCHIMRDLWESSQKQGDALRIPQPYFFAAHLDTLFLEALPGVIASDVMEDEELLLFAPQCGELLSAFQQCHVSGLDGALEEVDNATRLAHDSQQQLAAYYKVEKLLVDYDEALLPILSNIRNELERQLPELDEVPMTLIHTAFRFSQMMVDNGRLALLDFDGLENGNPLHDVGSFVAHLYKLHGKHGLALSKAEAAAHQFCQAYDDAAPWGGNEAWVAWQTAVILISKHAKRCIKRARKNPDGQIQTYLTLATELLSGKRLNSLGSAVGETDFES